MRCYSGSTDPECASLIVCICVCSKFRVRSSVPFRLFLVKLVFMSTQEYFECLLRASLRDFSTRWFPFYGRNGSVRSILRSSEFPARLLWREFQDRPEKNRSTTVLSAHFSSPRPNSAAFYPALL